MLDLSGETPTYTDDLGDELCSLKKKVYRALNESSSITGSFLHSSHTDEQLHLGQESQCREAPTVYNPTRGKCKVNRIKLICQVFIFHMTEKCSAIIHVPCQTYIKRRRWKSHRTSVIQETNGLKT